MKRGELAATSILNAVAPRVRRIAAPAIGILLLTSLPYRFLQMQFVDFLIRLRGDAIHYGNLLSAAASLIVVAYVISLYGRAVYIRACGDTPAGWRDLLKVDPRALLSYLYVGLLLELMFVMFSFTIIAVPLVAILAAIAAVVSAEPARPGLLLPLRALSPYLGYGKVLGGLTFVFAIGMFVAWINLDFLARLLLWTANAIPGFDAAKWQAAVGGDFPRYDLVTLACAITIVEPFWLAAMYVFGERVRSRQSGDDLLRRFRGLIAAEAEQQKLIRASAVVLALLLFPAMAPAQSESTITIEAYVRELEQMRGNLAQQKLAEASSRALALKNVRWVTFDRGRFELDRSLLESPTLQRLSVTIEALRARTPSPSPRPADTKLLEKLRSEEQIEELWRGGEIEGAPVASPGFFETMLRLYDRTIEWLARKLEWLYDLIRKLRPKRSKEEEREFLGVPVIVWLVTSLVVATVLLLAIYVLRRSRKRVIPVVSEEVLTSARDADPLSRESDEWERYAHELAAKGRIREAIRAWYHAVLVTLYRAGILHYQKGRTNWEYVRAVPPTAEWRPRFIAMTRLFDLEWYGHREGDLETLDNCMSNARSILDAVRA